MAAVSSNCCALTPSLLLQTPVTNVALTTKIDVLYPPRSCCKLLLQVLILITVTLQEAVLYSPSLLLQAQPDVHDLQRQLSALCAALSSEPRVGHEVKAHAAALLMAVRGLGA